MNRCCMGHHCMLTPCRPCAAQPLPSPPPSPCLALSPATGPTGYRQKWLPVHQWRSAGWGWPSRVSCSSCWSRTWIWRRKKGPPPQSSTPKKLPSCTYAAGNDVLAENAVRSFPSVRPASANAGTCRGSRKGLRPQQHWDWGKGQKGIRK